MTIRLLPRLETDLGIVLFNRKTRTPELPPVTHQILAKALDELFDALACVIRHAEETA
ncbi:hypothetical protein ABMC88_17645 [Sulfitobacter sp. HNIBRBA2951]|uniref:hypothetical protein n=1 Tax=Sulfitobacter aquimarinus TaxID=3158557 RepID=UPI0032E03CB7